MKKLFCVLFVFVLITLSACSKVEEDASDVNAYNTAPILGTLISENGEAGFYALTKDGTYTWETEDEDGNVTLKNYDGIFCLESDSLCKFTRSQTGGKITLKFTGSVESFEIFSAPKSEIEADKTKITDERYSLATNNTITFPESGEYYYLIRVKYTQGEVNYGFLLAQ